MKFIIEGKTYDADEALHRVDLNIALELQKECGFGLMALKKRASGFEKIKHTGKFWKIRNCSTLSWS